MQNNDIVMVVCKPFNFIIKFKDKCTKNNQIQKHASRATFNG